MGPRIKLPRPVAVAEVLEKVLKPADLQVLELRSRIRGAWEAAAGEAVAKMTRLVDYKGKVLWVEVPSNVWMQELQFRKGALLRSLQAALSPKALRDLRFTLARGGKAGAGGEYGE